MNTPTFDLAAPWERRRPRRRVSNGINAGEDASAPTLGNDAASLLFRDAPRSTNSNALRSTPPSTRAFTMIEIALSLAVIGFALVAIIGILPTAMEAQRENREETMINQDASVFLDAIRSGAQGMDDLTNYVIGIKIGRASCRERV